MAYVDGFVIPIPNGAKDAYVAHSRAFWDRVLAPAGALSCKECLGEDVPEGVVTSLPKAVQLEDGESVVFAWIIWPDKATRDACYASEMPEDLAAMPFDGKRMIFGGFEPIFEASHGSG